MTSPQDVTRKMVRDELKSFVIGAYSPAPLNIPAEHVLGYSADNLAGKSPVVQVTSGGMNQLDMQTFKGKFNVYHMQFEHFVIHSATNWTEEQAEDAIDEMARLALKLIADNKTHKPYWKSLELEGRTLVDKVQHRGLWYLYEVIPLQIKVF